MIIKHVKARDLQLSLILQSYRLKDYLEKSDLELLSTREELETRNKEAEWNMISKQIDFYKVNGFFRKAAEVVTWLDERGDWRRGVYLWEVQE